MRKKKRSFAVSGSASDTSDEIPTRSFDFVHLNHVLEHTSSPEALLKAAAQYLKPGGYLCAEVPNEVYSLAAIIKRFLGWRYRSCTAYFGHRTFFSPSTFRLLFQKTDLRIISLRTPAVTENILSLKGCFDRFQSLLGRGHVIEITAQHKTSATPL